MKDYLTIMLGFCAIYGAVGTAFNCCSIMELKDREMRNEVAIKELEVKAQDLERRNAVLSDDVLGCYARAVSTDAAVELHAGSHGMEEILAQGGRRIETWDAIQSSCTSDKRGPGSIQMCVKQTLASLASRTAPP